MVVVVLFQAEDGIRDLVRSRGLGDVYKRQVLDIGHGGGSFSYEVTEAMLDQGVVPDVISSDIHQTARQGPMFDLPTTLSKFLNPVSYTHLTLPTSDLV